TLEDADAGDPVRRDGPGVERRRRGRIDRDRLDAVDGDPGIRGPPARAAVLALVDALVGSGVQGRRLRGIRNETIDVAAERPPRGPDPALRQCGAGKGEETERYGEPKAWTKHPALLTRRPGPEISPLAGELRRVASLQSLAMTWYCSILPSGMSRSQTSRVLFANFTSKLRNFIPPRSRSSVCLNCVGLPRGARLAARSRIACSVK